MALLGITLDIDAAKNIASGMSVGSVVIAVAALWLVKNMVMRVLSVVLLLALGFGSYSQRANIVDCAEKVRATAGTQAVSCTFFGQSVEIPTLSDQVPQP
ncbi:MAG: hypothetical protein ACKOFT_01455 [Actinomycetota bacterium]